MKANILSVILIGCISLMPSITFAQSSEQKTRELEAKIQLLEARIATLESALAAKTSTTYQSSPPLFSKEPNIESLGFFAETDQGLIKLGKYGKDGLEGGFIFTPPHQFESVQRVDAFYINIPQFTITDENKLCWIGQPEFKDAMYNHQIAYFFPQRSQVLELQLTKTSTGIFKITVPEADRSRPGVLVVALRMPPGISDRAYPIIVNGK